MMGYGYGILMVIGALLIPLLLIAVVVAVIYYLFRNRDISGAQGNHRSVHDPIHVAEMRYAKGEISSQELNEIRDNLSRKE